MIENKQNITDYLQSYHEGKIKKGLGIDLPELDEHARFKRGEFNIINGLDNVGKTVVILWWFLCLSSKHNLKWCIYSGENKSGQLNIKNMVLSKGEKASEIPKVSAKPTRSLQLGRPLDFAMVSDHSEFLGEVRACALKDIYPKAYKSK